MAENVIFKAGGTYATNFNPPVLACDNCGAVIVPAPNKTEIVCRCGRIYKLLADGKPVETLRIR